MKIRSITYFCDPKYPLQEAVLREAGKFVARAKAAYEAAGYEVQTLRLATIPFPKLLGEAGIGRLPALAREFDLLLPQILVGYGSLGPALPDVPGSYEVIPEAIAASKSTFFGGVMADSTIGLDPAAVKQCARIMVKAGTVDRNGFANLRFAALANVKAGSPFFPASYFDGGRPAFALATEAADLAVEAFESARSVEEGRAALVAEIERHAAAMTTVATQLAAARGAGRSKLATARFLGIDFSLATYPKEAVSIGNAIEKMGLGRVGAHGSLAAAAILTECIARAGFRRTGFSGLMLPVLEDATLAQRAAEGALRVKDLLLYSAVCGTGLDCVPLPGATSAEEIAAVLTDLSALAVRLNKPLTARLLPIPSKKAGEATGFEFEYFANSRVMALEAGPLRGALGGDEPFTLRARK